MALDGSSLTRLQQVDDRSAGFRTVTQMHPPFLVPYSLQRLHCDGRKSSGDVRPAHRGETILRLGPFIGASWIGSYIQRVKYEKSYKICLIQHIFVRISG